MLSLVYNNIKNLSILLANLSMIYIDNWYLTDIGQIYYINIKTISAVDSPWTSRYSLTRQPDIGSTLQNWDFTDIEFRCWHDIEMVSARYRPDIKMPAGY